MLVSPQRGHLADSAPPIPAPRGLRATRFELEGSAFALLEWPLRRRDSGWPLTPAEAAVLRLLMEGLSNAEIARRRRRSPRTIANQIASVFRRFKVSSRSELFVALARPSPGKQEPDDDRPSSLKGRRKR